ncbi:molybdopterin-guanine dinucleotide biosynthesis protein B [Bacillus sp. DNRA2]|uniref:molybdopterin-guanine dinucleotide biosynthesis protein B n=1 Tax=Bacillus sp. DNRA2 TaxID=2723053 RepID=UPI00145D0393|nr:molybdopterin-guanine dinucleotide biosynthesis protein B [Bacillus sp. DNRA2]NMD70816.1 molybdopterin-guanine dinucleotide biosynthesis protein B [Bacillus sp. DNRA2]
MAVVDGVKQPVIFQLAGYSNSGKTTLLNKLISLLSEYSERVVTLKHHGHGGRPDLLQNKDSSQHLASGAMASLVEGDGRILLQAEKQSWTLAEQIQLIAPLQPDFILIEGHKEENYPKAVLIRKPQDIELLTKLSNIVVVYCWDKGLVSADPLFGVPVFQIDDKAGLWWLKEFLYGMKNTTR